MVVAGAAVFEIDGERVDAPTGTMILVPVGVHREATRPRRPTRRCW